MTMPGDLKLGIVGRPGWLKRWEKSMCGLLRAIGRFSCEQLFECSGFEDVWFVWERACVNRCTTPVANMPYQR